MFRVCSGTICTHPCIRYNCVLIHNTSDTTQRSIESSPYKTSYLTTLVVPGNDKRGTTYTT